MTAYIGGQNPNGDPCICGTPGQWHPDCYGNESLAISRMVERLKRLKRMPTKNEQRYFRSVFGQNAVDRLIAEAKP